VLLSSCQQETPLATQHTMKDAIKLAKAALKHAEQNISAAYKAEGLAFKQLQACQDTYSVADDLRENARDTLAALIEMSKKK